MSVFDEPSFRHADAATLATVRERLALASLLAGWARQMEASAVKMLVSAVPSDASRLRAGQADAALQWDAVTERLDRLSIGVNETEGRTREDTGRDV